MKRHSTRPTTRTLPRRLRFVLWIVAGLMLVVAWDQSHWWTSRDDGSFGWLVPLFTAYCLYDRWDRIGEALDRAFKSPPARPVRLARDLVAGLSLLAGLALLFIGSGKIISLGHTPEGTILLTAGMALASLSLIYLAVQNRAGTNASVSVPGKKWRALLDDKAASLTGCFLYPVLVWLISAPLWPPFEEQLNQTLQRPIVSVCTFSFNLLGYPIASQGYTIFVPGGPLSVSEACSGVRSLTACVFAGSFLGATFFSTLTKKIALVVLAMIAAFLLNIGRALFLTGWAYAYGPHAINGFVHDTAGYISLGLTCLLLLGLIPALNVGLFPTPSRSPGKSS